MHNDLVYLPLLVLLSAIDTSLHDNLLKLNFFYSLKMLFCWMFGSFVS